MATAEEVQEDSLEKTKYKCSTHNNDLVPLLCKECNSPVCLDCVVTNHAGHKMCKISDCIETKVMILNDAVQRKEFACFRHKQNSR